ncbi:RNA ligase family protein [Vibrio parahaemolyticus]|nr:2'-5' RNA ligase [Vibrio parahaemolyticus]EJG0180750.1 RNA ligase family protein [Vibrio parahaemolyticus]
MEILKPKYPRTYHLPFSEAVFNDDKLADDFSMMDGEEVCVSIKKDGQCTTFTSDYIHARSAEMNSHESSTWVKQLHAKIRYMMNPNHRICGENLYAKHSIHYKNLPDYFMCFNTWDRDTNMCHSWDETVEICESLGLTTVEVVYRGIFDMDKIKAIFQNLDKEKEEGIVVRLARGFHYDEFQKCVMKAVRKGHVQTDQHWSHQKVVPNELIQ